MVVALEEIEQLVCMSMWPSCTENVTIKKNLEKFKLFKLGIKWAKAEIKTLTKSDKNATIGLYLNRFIKT